MPTIIGAGDSSSGDFITNSLSFNEQDDAKLSFDPDGAGNVDTMTLSFWFKPDLNFGGDHNNIFSVRPSAGAYTMLTHRSTHELLFEQNGVGDILKTNRKFRDPAAWYHIVLALDSTNGTAAQRARLYVNGVEETSFATDNRANISQNADFLWGGGNPHQISGDPTGNYFYGGYLADFNYVNGTQLAPTSFGETNDNGVWIPKKYSGAYGTNGFHLEFKQTGTSANASGIGADTSGNGNHFTPTNLAATDIGIDTPQNNYCTINSVYADDGNNLVQADFSEGNRKMLSTVDGWKFGRGTFLLEAGKWYVEVKATETGNGENGRFGLQPSQGGEALGNSDDNDTFEGCVFNLGGSDTNLQKIDTGSSTTIFSDFSSGSTAMLAFDLDNDKVWIGRNGTWYNNNNASSTLDASNHDFALPSVTLGWVFGFGIPRNGSDNITFEYNWGNPAHAISSGNSDADDHGNFEYAVPSGFYAVNSKNLATYG